MKAKANFNLSADCSLLIGSDEEVQDYKSEPKKFSNLPWYILSRQSNFYIIKEFIMQGINFFQMVITPLQIIYEEISADVIQIQLVFDVILLSGIVLRFFTENGDNRSLVTIAKSYIKSTSFAIDIFSVIPSLITREENNTIQCLKFLRLLRFSSMFNPIYTAM